jgi:hypothetical protein
MGQVLLRRVALQECIFRENPLCAGSKDSHLFKFCLSKVRLKLSHLSEVSDVTDMTSVFILISKLPAQFHWPKHVTRCVVTCSLDRTHQGLSKSIWFFLWLVLVQKLFHVQRKSVHPLPSIQSFYVIYGLSFFWRHHAGENRVGSIKNPLDGHTSKVRG